MQRTLTITCLIIFLWTGISWATEDLPLPSWWDQASRDAIKKGYQLIPPIKLQALQKSGETFLLVDVRPEYEYCQGHLPNALNMTFDLGDQLSLPDLKKSALTKMLGPDQNRMVVIYCRSFR